MQEPNVAGHTVVSHTTLYVVIDQFSRPLVFCSRSARHSDEAATDECCPARYWPSSQVYRSRSSYSRCRRIRFLLAFV